MLPILMFSLLYIYAHADIAAMPDAAIFIRHAARYAGRAVRHGPVSLRRFSDTTTMMLP